MAAPWRPRSPPAGRSGRGANRPGPCPGPPRPGEDATATGPPGAGREPSRPGREGDQRSRPGRTGRGRGAMATAWIHAPAVHADVAAVTRSGLVAERRASRRGSARRRHRPRRSAGDPAEEDRRRQDRPRHEGPGGVSRRSAKTPIGMPRRLSTTRGMGSPLVSPTVSSPAPRATVMAERQAPAGRRRRRGLSSSAGRASATARSAPGMSARRPGAKGSRPRKTTASRHLADRAGDRRPDDPGHDPGRRQHREQLRPELGPVGPGRSRRRRSG